jgi:hypothetical protein
MVERMCVVQEGEGNKVPRLAARGEVKVNNLETRHCETRLAFNRAVKEELLSIKLCCTKH